MTNSLGDAAVRIRDGQRADDSDFSAGLHEALVMLEEEGLENSWVRHVREHEVLRAEFDLEIGAGLGTLAGKVWRVGLMGQSACRRNVLFFLAAMEAILGRSGAAAAAR